MLVTKIFNNNSVVARDDGKEVIVRGKALGFKYKPGDTLENSDIEKVYILQDKNIKNDLNEFDNKTQRQYFNIAEKIIKYAEKHLNISLNQHIHRALADHINFAVERYHNNIPIVNQLLYEVKKLYPEEFKVGLYGLHTISVELGINLSEDEAGNIAFHIVNAQQENSNIKNIIAMTKIINDILNIVKYHFNIILEEKSINYNRFVTHLQFFTQRLLENRTLKSNDDFLYLQVTKKYDEEYKCVKKIEAYIKKTLNHNISHDEIVYLTIHINRIISNI